MSAESSPPRVPWIRPGANKPACDVPWLGTSIVQADGKVNFCCYSEAVVGNVNETTFDEIWNGSAMQQIRSELIAGRLPHECRSMSCPIFRGDELHHIRDRMEGTYSLRRTGSTDPHQGLREEFQASELSASRGQVRSGEDVRVELSIRLTGVPFGVDLFVSLRGPDGTLRFLPSLEDYAVPFASGVSVGGKETAVSLTLWDAPLPDPSEGDHEICAALFEKDADPNLITNCYWATQINIRVNPPFPFQSAWWRLRRALMR